jgi:hypothetical protein
VLRHIGQDRQPTVDEAALYEKWNKRWKFSQQAILDACAGMTRTGTPNFAYLDKILEGLHQKEMYAPEQIAEMLAIPEAEEEAAEEAPAEEPAAEKTEEE